MAQATTPSTSTSDGVQRDSDLLGKWQSSPVGRTAAAIHSLINEIDELRRLSRFPAAIQAMSWEGEDLLEAHQQLGRLLLRISAARADLEVAS